jgi:hypothetical protein
MAGKIPRTTSQLSSNVSGCRSNAVVNIAAEERHGRFLMRTLTVKGDALTQTHGIGRCASVGVVVGTFAAVPYVHLHLEAALRYTPGVEFLIHDDASPDAGQLHALVTHYKHSLFVTPCRRHHSVGDMSAFNEGLKWAHRRKLDILVKMSRRFIPVAAWVSGLRLLAWRSQTSTYAASCPFHGFRIMTECMAMHVPSWWASGAAEEIRKSVKRNQFQWVEPYMYERAQQAYDGSRHLRRCTSNEGSESPYAIWDMVQGGRRSHGNHRRLWHELHSPADYAKLASSFGLEYLPRHFANPDQGGVTFRPFHRPSWQRYATIPLRQ